MVEELFDNGFFMDSDKALELIQFLFESELPSFELVKVFDEGIYFGAEYKKDNVEIRFGGERGGFEHKTMINGQQYSLLNFDDRMKNIYSASEKNYRFAFDILKYFLADPNLAQVCSVR